MPTWKRLLKVGSTWAVTAADSMRTPLASRVLSWWTVHSTNRRWMGDTSLRRRTTGIAKGGWVEGGLSHRKRPPHQAGRVGGCVLTRRTGRSWTVAPASTTTRFRTKTCANRQRCWSRRQRRRRRCRRRWRSRQSRLPPAWTDYFIQVCPRSGGGCQRGRWNWRRFCQRGRVDRKCCQFGEQGI